MKCIGFVAGVAVALGTMTAGMASSRTGESGDRAVRAAVDALDRCVQDRFIRTDKGFGMSRIATAMHNISRFIPVDESERNVAREFEAMDVRVVMYLASRQKPRTSPLGFPAIPSLIQGPILVNPARFEAHADPRVPTTLPNEADLKAQASASFTAFAESDSREFDLGRWRFVARPVRASAETCLRCHNPGSSVEEPFRLGDPIGAVLYGYQTATQRP